VEYRQLHRSTLRFSRAAGKRTGMLGAVLFLLFAAPGAGFAECTGKPTVWMNERTAASHLLSSRKFVFPAVVPVLARIRNVVVTVTVNRKGDICNVNAGAGPAGLRAAAEKIVRSSWRYRPFLLDRKPVVVQFPVTVHFVISADRRDERNPEVARAGEWPMLPGTPLPLGKRIAIP
jgi:hypothetical protein